MSLLDDDKELFNNTSLYKGMPTYKDAIFFQERSAMVKKATTIKEKVLEKIFHKKPIEYVNIIEGSYEYKNEFLFPEFPDEYLRITFGNTRIHTDQWNISLKISNYSKNDLKKEDNRSFLEMLYGSQSVATTFDQSLNKFINYDNTSMFDAQRAAYELFLKICKNPEYLDKINSNWRVICEINNSHRFPFFYSKSCAEGYTSQAKGSTSQAEGSYITYI